MMERKDFSHRYLESTLETIRVMYQKRDSETGQTVEDVNGVIYRVAEAVALAELKYVLKPAEIVELTLEQALAHPVVVEWIEKFADNIGNQLFWPNTPASVNADPAVSLMVLQYEAHGMLAIASKWSPITTFDDIWSKTDEWIKYYECQPLDGPGEAQDQHGYNMGRLASKLKGKGCLAACGVAFVEDTLESIQEAARMETLATKGAMGMGLNTSNIRPWNSVVANGPAA